jgi:signal transduction histidine kinase
MSVVSYGAVKERRESTLEQAALRRVATLVAQGAQSRELFAVVAEEVGRVVGAPFVAVARYESETVATVCGSFPPKGSLYRTGQRVSLDGVSVLGRIRAHGEPARIDDYADLPGEVAHSARISGIGSGAGVPIVVAGRVWGSIVAWSMERLPEDFESRLGEFTELLAAAIANSEATEALSLLADEQAALRRVATLVASDAPPGDIFDTVAMEVGKLLDTDVTVVGRYDGDGAATAIGSWSSSPGGVPVGTRSAVGGHNVLTLVAETERPARVDGYDDASGEAADIARRHGWNSSVAAPIIVEGRLWGVMLVATKRPEPFPAGAEERVSAFTGLLATALANAQAHDELRRFGEEQAALGRVATLVAAGAAPEQVFTAVVEEVSSLLALERIELVHYDGDVSGTVVASSGDHPFPAGSTWSLDDPSVMATVARTRHAARVDDYTGLNGKIAHAARRAGFRSAIGAPITVEGRLWGVIIAISTDPEPIPERSEARLGQFTELVATAVANAEARGALARLADEQAALRRVATLVAQAVQPEEIFSAVGAEIGRLFGTTITTVGRFEPDAQALIAVGVGTGSKGIPIGSRWELDDRLASGEVFRTGRSARVDEADWSAIRGSIAQVGRRLGVVSTVASPIFAAGRLWGVVSVSDYEPLPPEAEERLEKFSELIATAIANAESSAELAASRRRIVAAGDEARRRIERDLHDGIQQRLIALGFHARAMTRRPAGELPGIAADLAEGLKDTADELREVSRGIHPTILTEAGLGPALRALARRSDIPIDVDVSLDERLPAPIEAAAYYIASEALTNVAKHANATVVELTASHGDGFLALEVRDDGSGGVDAGRGSGILGLTDRVEALGGTISIVSPPRVGTTLSVRLPTGP